MHLAIEGSCARQYGGQISDAEGAATQRALYAVCVGTALEHDA